MPDALDDRLRAVERALDDDDRAASATTTEEQATQRPATGHDDDRAERLDDIEARLDEAESTLADLEAAVQALRGYAGQVRSVDERVEERADAALAAVERLEDRLGAMAADGSSTAAAAGRTPGSGSRPRREDRDEPDAHDAGCDCDCHDRSRDAEWPTSPAPRFAGADEADREPGLLARLRDRL